MRLLHLCLDEKFIPFAAKVYEAAYPGSNRFLAYRADVSAPVLNVPGENLEHIGPKTFASSRFRQQLGESDCLVIHSLDADFVPVVATAPEHLKVIWHAWGADIYPILGAAAPPIYLPRTRTLVARMEVGRRLRFLAQPGQLLYRLRRKWRYKRYLQACLTRFDQISMAPAEFALLHKCRPEIRGQFRHFHYNSVEDVFARGPARMQGPDILLGNSASPSNNHLEALDLLAGTGVAGRKILCPLSYGGDDANRTAYTAEIIAAGKQRFGGDFVPLPEFIPFDEYSRMLAGCGTVIMNHVRQQAVGTIGMALYKGARVYLRRDNMVADYFRDIGCAVFDLQEAHTFTSETPADEQAANRVALEAWYGFERVVDCVRGYDVI